MMIPRDGKSANVLFELLIRLVLLAGNNLFSQVLRNGRLPIDLTNDLDTLNDAQQINTFLEAVVKNAWSIVGIGRGETNVALALGTHQQ
jgi:hypothetical protein